MGLALLALALALALAGRAADASIHEYSAGGFAPRANSFFFHGGSEGLYASDPSSNSSASFIRYAGRTPPGLLPLGFCGDRAAPDQAPCGGVRI